MARSVVIGLGNRLRGDDGIGLEVARRVAARRPDIEVIEHEREPLDLIDLWDGAARAVVVDAVAGAEPGRIHRLDPAAGMDDWRGRAPASSHALGLAQVVELAGVIGRLPGGLEVIGIEGTDFATGTAPSAAVRRAGVRIAVELVAAMPARDSVVSTREA